MKKVTIVGTDYMGVSLAVLFGQKCNLFALNFASNIMQEKVDLLNKREFPIKDSEIECHLKNREIKIKATTDLVEAYEFADFTIICTPTNYDEEKSCFDAFSVEEAIENVLEHSGSARILTKSTVSVGFVQQMKSKYHVVNLMFSPRFLRERKTLYDNLYLLRIIVGDKLNRTKEFASLLKECVLKRDILILFTESTEVEAIKLFSSTYFEIRMSYFNEPDTYAETKGLNMRDIFTEVCFDPRIGYYYNNPSFGYGGYCSPKYIKRLKSNYKSIPENSISALVKSNSTRKDYLAKELLNKKGNVVGVYRLAMQRDSDNFRFSTRHGNMNRVKSQGAEVVISDSTLHTTEFSGYKIINDLNLIKEMAEIIIATRIDSNLQDVKEKVYTRDLYERD